MHVVHLTSYIPYISNPAKMVMEPYTALSIILPLELLSKCIYNIKSLKQP